MAFVITMAVIIAVIALCLHIPLLFEFIYGAGKYENETSVYLHIWKIKIALYPKKKKSKKKKKKKQEEKKEKEKDENSGKLSGFRDKINKVHDGYNLLKDDIFKLLDYLVRKGAIFRKINLFAEFGFEDATSTGIGYGIINGIVYNVLGVLHRLFTINDWKIDLIPDFNNQKTDIRFECILKTHSAHIIKMIGSIIKMYFKYSNRKEE